MYDGESGAVNHSCYRVITDSIHTAGKTVVRYDGGSGTSRL